MENEPFWWQYLITWRLSPDPVINLFFILGLIIAGICVFLLLLIQLIRLFQQVNNWRRQRIFKQWQDLLLEPFDPEKPNLPRIARRERLNFLNLWNFMHGSIRGDIANNMNDIAKHLKMPAFAHKMLSGGNLFRKMMAITTLGHLRDETAWKPLVGYMKSSDTSLSLVAARSLVKINAEKAVPLFVKHLATRPDWPITKVDSILNESYFDDIYESMTEALKVASSEVAINLIKYLQYSNNISASPILRQLLKESTNTGVIAATLSALAHFRDEESLAIVREYAEDENWYVKLHAVSALGKVGTAEDVGTVLKLLSDKQWWVRYRAAQALSELPSVDLDRMKQLHSMQTDLYARDILNQVIAEKEKDSQ